jgi:hypothetical protein
LGIKLACHFEHGLLQVFHDLFAGRVLQTELGDRRIASFYEETGLVFDGHFARLP